MAKYDLSALKEFRLRYLHSLANLDTLIGRMESDADDTQSPAYCEVIFKLSRRLSI